MSEPIRAQRRSEIGLAESTYGPRLGRLSHSRVSWGAVLSGVFVALAVQLLINQIMVWAKFGLGKVLAPTDIASHTTGIGLWLALSATIGVFAGCMVASRVAGSRDGANGLLHGASVWGFTVVGSLILSATGFAALMGFGITPHTIVSYFGLTGSAGAGLSGVVRTLSGWFLLQVFASMVFGLGGGYIAASGGRAGVAETTVEEEERYEERRAA
jgi:hypothetical protein